MELDYLKLLKTVREKGKFQEDRTGVGSYSIFGAQLRTDLSKGFPMITTKRVPWKSVATELLWFIAGRSDVAYLQERKVSIWDEWEKEDGTIGPGYGHQWRDFGGHHEYVVGGPAKYVKGVDQLKTVVERIKTNPTCRRLIVSAWNPQQIPDMALPPCHAFFQFHVEDGKLSCQMYQRSCDMFLGVPFNIASYALLTHLVANECGLGVGDFIHTYGNAHIYKNHLNQVDLQLRREPYAPPKLLIRTPGKSIFDISIDDFALQGYAHHDAIKGDVAV